ncbi:MAG: TonB-dependent receptor [Pseudomonadota bacterium]
MARFVGKRHGKEAIVGFVSTLAVMAAGPESMAQDALAEPSGRNLTLPASPLGDTLRAINEGFGVGIIASDDLVGGKTSPAIRGARSADEALRIALQGTELTTQALPNGAYVIAQRTMDTAEPALPDTIIVTGTKQGLGIQDTQASITVITGEAIEEQAIINIDDLLLRTPNVAGGGSNSLNTASIRGVTLEGIGFAGQAFTANVYVDGSPNSFNANQGANNLWDVAQVEILRGPQSTTQGRNALGGAIIINTADPEYEWGGSVRARAGNEEQQQYSGFVTGPLIEDQVAFRLAADYREVDFDIVNADTGNNTRFEEATTLRAKLLIEPEAIDGLRVELITSFADTEFGEFGQVTSPVPANDPTFGAFDPFGRGTFGTRTRFEDSESIRYTADINYELNENWTIFALGTYEETERNTDFGPGSFNEASDETYTAELRATFDYDRLTGWIGGYYFDATSTDDIIFISPLSIFPFPLTVPDAVLTATLVSDIETENTAVFGEISYEISDRWSVNFGARYDQEDFANNGQQGSSVVEPAGCTVLPGVPFFGGTPCELLFPVSDQDPSSASYDAFLPRGSIIHSFDDLRSLSFNVSRGYRAGGSYIFADTSVAEVRTFDPEFVTNYELAWRSQWPAYDLTVNANLFYTDWTDQQVSITGPGGGVLEVDTLNVGSSELYGLEVEIDKKVNDDLDVFASIGLLHTEFIDFPFAVGSGTEFENLDGNEFNNAPTFNISGGFTYQNPTGFFVNATAAYSGEQFSDVTNLEINKNESYTLVNGRVGYRHELFELSVFADNLLNERFSQRRGLSTVNSGTGIAEFNEPGAFFNVNDPRLWGIELRVSY